MKVYSVHTPIIHTLLWLAIGVGCLAADIEAPALATPHTLVDIRAKTEGKGYAWLVLGHEGTPVRVKVDSGDKSQATFTGPPGRYVVWLVVSLQDGTLDQGQAVVVIGSPGPSPPQPEPGPGPVDPKPTPAPTTDKATAATYVVQRGTAAPGAILAAISDLNAKGIKATMVLHDTRDGDGEVPDQYKIAFTAAKEAGLPALVIQAGDKVLKVVKQPKEEDFKVVK